jgi:hypothetical protein
LGNAVTATVEQDVTAGAPAVVRRRRIAWWEWLAVGLAMGVVAAIGVVAIRRGAPLLWDEAVYSLRVRALTTDAVIGPYWLDVRAPGLPLVLTPTALWVGASDVAFRVTCLAFAVAGVGVTWVIARLLTSPAIAATTAWLLAIAPGWHESSWQVMPDIPGTTLALAAMAAVLLAARGDRISWWAPLAAAPLAFGATLIRYGAPLLIGPTILAALALRWPAVRNGKLRAAATLLAPAIAAGIVWFIPQVTNSPRPPVLIYSGRQDAKAIPAAESAADFMASLGQLVGPVLGALIIIGAIGAIIAARHNRRLRNAAIAATLIALSVLIAMLVGIAQYHLRYLTPALPFLALLTAIGLITLATRLPRPITITAIALLTITGTTLATQTATGRADGMERAAGQVRGAYTVVDERTDGPCVLLDRHASNEWYSHCASLRPYDIALSVRRMGRRNTVAPDEPMYAIIRHSQSEPNLQGEEAEALEELALSRVEVSPKITVVDVGTYGRFVEAFRERGLLDRRQ